MSAGTESRRLHGVVLAGGRGTRFWPRSRKGFPKQLQAVVGETPLLRQTVERLRPLIPPERIWVVTGEPLRRRVIRELPETPRRQVIAEPVQRNTGPAIALAAKLIEERDPGAVMGVFPSDHFIGKPRAFLSVLRRAARAAAEEKLVVLGIRPEWPETGYGYIEFPRDAGLGKNTPLPVSRFREKPKARAAARYLRAGNFYWNSGMFLWRAGVIREAVERYMPETAAAIAGIAPLGSPKFRSTLAARYPRCENLSIDYGVLERASNIVGFPCRDLGWSDVGSWEAVYKLLPKDADGNVLRSPAHIIDARGNYVDARDAVGAKGRPGRGSGKAVALIGVDNLVVVDTPDALLVCSRSEAQRVSQLVKQLEALGDYSLL